MPTQSFVFPTGRMHVPAPTPLANLRTLTMAATDGVLPALLGVWRKYGDLCEFRIGPMKTILVVQPNHVRQVLVEDRAVFVKTAGVFADRIKGFFGEGLFMSEGETWRRQRKLMQPPFTAKSVTRFAELMQDEAEQFLARRANSPGAFDVSHEMMHITMNVICRSVFDYSVGDDLNRLGEMITTGLEIIMADAVSPIVIPKQIPIPRNRRYLRVVTELDRLVNDIIAARKARPSQEPRLIDDLLTDGVSTGGAETGMTAKQLRDEIITMFAAGHETTALALIWTWYLLAHHPEIERRLHAELDSVLAGRRPTVQDIENLPLTAAVFQEAMRLYPPLPGVLREAAVDHHIGGRRIKKGTYVFMSPFLTQRHPDLWADPDAFNPDRFLGEAGKQIDRYAYFPFGAGPRTCLGIHFAMLEGLAVLAMVAQRHRVVHIDRQAARPTLVGSLRPQKPIRMKLVPRTVRQ